MNQKILEKLNNREIINEFSKTVNDAIFFDLVDKANEIIIVLDRIFSRNPDFKKINPSLFSVYFDFFIAAKFIIIFNLEEDEIIALIKDNFYFVLNNTEYDLYYKIRQKIKNIHNLQKRDIFKGKIRKALLECGITLGEEDILVNEQRQKPTIANWLKNYYIKFGMGRADTLKLNDYLVKDPNIKSLSTEERVKLKNLFNFFENMKVSSVKFPMFEENFTAILPNGEIAIMSHERAEKISREISKLYNEVKDINIQTKQKSYLSSMLDLEQAAQEYPVGSLERKAIEEEIARAKKLST